MDRCCMKGWHIHFSFFPCSAVRSGWDVYLLSVFRFLKDEDRKIACGKITKNDRL